MRKLALAIGTLAAIGVATFAAMPAAAATTVSVKMTLTESADPLRAGWPGSEPCPDIGLNVNCGTGEVIPFGQATEIVSIGACGELCSLRWIILAQGVMLLRETAGDFSCPGACASQWPHGAPASLPLTAVVVDGTGIFQGASGTLTGTVRIAAFQAQIKYTGTLTLAE